MKIERYLSGPRMSKAVALGDIVYTSGQMAVEKRGASITEQTVEVLRLIEDYLAAAGSDKTRLLMVNIWLADISDFDEMNRVWDDWAPSGHLPARATVEARLNSPDCGVEIAAVAAR
jgi:enamine deaminase RidA (YjgF/YER057c/UK114 family)